MDHIGSQVLVASASSSLTLDMYSASSFYRPENRYHDPFVRAQAEQTSVKE
jgi:hypothetical protein